MNFVRDEINGNKDWRNKDGAPLKRDLVLEWRKANPDGRKIDCHRETGLSRMTIDKWWDCEEEPIVFAESEVTLGLLDALARNGIRSVNILSDDEYEEHIAMGFGDWLIDRQQKKK